MPADNDAVDQAADVVQRLITDLVRRQVAGLASLRAEVRVLREAPVATPPALVAATCAGVALGLAAGLLAWRVAR